jgi:hypothetical protein
MSTLMSILQDAHEQHALSKCKPFGFSGICQGAHEKKEGRPPLQKEHLEQLAHHIRGATFIFSEKSNFRLPEFCTVPQNATLDNCAPFLAHPFSIFVRKSNFERSIFHIEPKKHALQF